ncbi:hypothetical protein ACFE04_024874 [Oxalis oulophora]
MGTINNLSGCLQIQPEPEQVGPIKLVKSDGLVKIYDRPVEVSELMSEFPKHLVCRSDSFYIGQKIPHLSGAEQLQLGNIYFLLPMQLFQSVLSFVTLASFAAANSKDSRNAFLKKTAANCKPFDIQKSASGGMKIRVSDEFISQLIEKGGLDQECDDHHQLISSRVCNTQQLDKEYKRLVTTLRGQWKPKLDTIKESRREKRHLSEKKKHNKCIHDHPSTKNPLKDRIKKLRCRN